ncbi:Protein Jade-1 like [Actinidia chinensis var. chinensis]|uniref:Protein Jade-1 like n=1 Tax=Actinidia chinensis var. chinensis TaxID=1590841 RepID=A0A2R6RP28_ACTCC|nr:Protein Jade-1 like [Actinidia chinensis var. chinensis]
MQGWWWWRLVEAMTGGRCHRRRKMMGRAPDGGCGTEEKSCPISRGPAKFPAKEPSTLKKPKPTGIDLYTQARKALCDRLPFDAEDTQVSTIPTLPSGLVNCLLRHSDGRKRQKRAHSGTEAKSSRSEKAGRSNIWAETEDCFRELTVEDIDKLHELSISVFSASQKCLSIPVLGNVVLDSVDSGDIANEVKGVNANGFGSDCGVGVKEEVNEEEKQFMDVDSVGVDVLVEEEKGCSSSQVATEKGAKLCSGVQWLLGSRSKIHLTSERPSKKRKLLGGDAGLEKLLVACPVEGLSSLCHYCSLGDTGDQLNRLIVCSSCNVAVHQRCYGVQDDVAGPWLCSWCKNGNAVQSSERPCLLCPRQGGALKPVSKRGVESENGSSMEFAHLFCCQWMPEVYIQDTRTLEPIANVEEITETRRKLICYLCKVKYGACVRCSNGTCRTSFHPICAREAKHRMEIWGKLGCDEVELRAFCSKHSGVQNGSSTQQSGDESVAIGSDPLVTMHQLETSTVNKPHKLKIGRKNGDRTVVHIETTDNNINTLGNCVMDEGLSDTRSNSRFRSGCGDTQKHTSKGTLDRSTNDDANASDSLDITLILKKVVKSLPQEIDDIGKRKWDAVLVNQYLSELREAKKQGRKERRHKEAQAVLAAATAAAAASLRNSSFRKDALDESAHQETLSNVNPLAGRAGLYFQQMPQAKETLSKLVAPRVSSEMKSDFGQSISDLCKEHPRTCDICGRSETILNPILVCSSCKVGVHLDCYRNVKDSTGPWYCELCEEFLSSSSSGAAAVNSWEKPYFAAECGLCGGSPGAFRKSIDGQWVHAFCAEWVLESTFKRGQVNPVEGLDSVLKGSDVCHVCQRKQGVCIKCNYGHCQSMFHPSCARSAGFYVNTKTSGGKLQHKAYCLKHSLEQRAKAETQGHGIEELKSLKQIRVELERLRLLCERIIRREKLKRELVLCSQDILVSNRDSTALSALVRGPFFPPDVSSESATTSLRNTDDCRSGSEAIQRSDDVTVDSTVSGKRRIKFPMSMDNDQKTDDSSTSQHLFIQKPRERISFAGKQIPQRSSFVASQSLSDDGEKRSKCRKHTETFEKELVMTSDQATVKNQRLPKGFVYVPVRCLSKEKDSVPDAYSGQPLERDR